MIVLTAARPILVHILRMYFELERLIIRELEEADLKPLHEGS